MSRRVLLIGMLIGMLALASCDIVYFVAVNNYGEESKVTVEYNRLQTYYGSNSDTLPATGLQSTVDTLIVRTNIDSNSYYYTAPARHQVALKPRSLGTPIRKVSFQTEADSTLTVHLYGDNWRQLLHQGVVETKGFIFTHSILINRK